MSMETVTSRDGTTIAYWRSGHGPPLVLVHGAISDRRIWAGVQRALGDRFTLYSINRRGQEGSGAPRDHDLERDFEDVVAVIDAIGEPVHLLGHSSGAHCALGAALLTEHVRSLILYEPPPPGPRLAAVAKQIRELVDAGRPDDAVVRFIGQARTAELKKSPIWPVLLAFAPSLAVDVAAVAHHTFDASRFGVLDIPVLLLVGGNSGPGPREVSNALAQVLRNVQVRELAGQGHMANLEAPELFSTEVAKFLEGV